MQMKKSSLFFSIVYTISKLKVRRLFNDDWAASPNNSSRWRLKKYFLNSKIVTLTKLNPVLLIDQWPRNNQGGKVRFLLTELPGMIMI